MNLKYICSCAGVFKLITIVVGFLCFAVGSAGFFGQSFRTQTNQTLLIKCGGSGDCSSGLRQVEPYFLVIVGIAFLVSTVGLLLFMLCFNSKGCLKKCDEVFHIAAAACLIIVGTIIIASTIQTDANQKQQQQEQRQIKNIGGVNVEILSQNELRGFEMFKEKLAAGGLAILNGFLYFIATCIICCEPEDMT